MSDRRDKYAAGEYERRFLLRRLPAGLSDPRRITDRYIDGTRLRVRLVADSDGVIVQQKLGHKRRLRDDDPTAIMHTSLYLDDAEHRLLRNLPGHELIKTRWPIEVTGRPAAVDVFEGALTGLIMLEIDFGAPDELASFVPPEWTGPEITHVETFTGGTLARLSADDLEDELRSRWGQSPS